MNRLRTASPAPSCVNRSERIVHGFTICAKEVRRASMSAEIPVVFIPGMETRWDVCDPLFAALDARLRLVNVDLPWGGRQGNGWGLAAPPHEWVREGLEVATASAAVVVAHSFGANALLEYLRIHGGGLVRAAVFIAPFYRATTEEFDWSVLRYYVDQFGHLLEEGLAVRKSGSTEHIAAMAEKVRERIGPYGWVEFFRLFLLAPTLDLGRLEIPCLVLAGANDFAAFPEYASALARALPMAEAIVLPDCGHFCAIERPDLVARAINEFLERAVLAGRHELHAEC